MIFELPYCERCDRLVVEGTHICAAGVLSGTRSRRPELSCTRTFAIEVARVMEGTKREGDIEHFERIVRRADNLEADVHDAVEKLGGLGDS